MATQEEKKKTGSVVTRSNNSNAAQPGVVLARSLDFGDLKPVWDRLRAKERPEAESHLFKINTRATKIDPLVEKALLQLEEAFKADEPALHQLITRKGWATELDRVLKRINAMRISENKRIILSVVYPYLLEQLLGCEDADKEVDDAIGFSEAVFFELERSEGPLDYFAKAIVELVGTKHRISFADDNVLRDLVAHQVRTSL